MLYPTFFSDQIDRYVVMPNIIMIVGESTMGREKQ